MLPSEQRGFLIESITKDLIGYIESGQSYPDHDFASVMFNSHKDAFPEVSRYDFSEAWTVAWDNTFHRPWNRDWETSVPPRPFSESVSILLDEEGSKHAEHFFRALKLTKLADSIQRFRSKNQSPKNDL